MKEIVDHHDCPIRIGDKVWINDGSDDGIEGIIACVDNRRALIDLSDGDRIERNADFCANRVSIIFRD